MSIFEYDDYKKWVNDKIQAMPNRGRGQFRRVANFLNTSPTIVTQVFKGNRELTPEQAVLLSEYFALSKIESRFFILLVNHSRAGTHRYKELLKEEIHDLRVQSREIRHRVDKNLELSKEAKSILYSNWYYLAIWSLTAIEGFNSISLIAEKLQLDRKKAREALDFLLEHSLVIQDENNRLNVGPTLIHLESDSLHIPRHHHNWRLQAFRHYEDPGSNDIFYSAPVTLSEKDVGIVRERILNFISETVSLIKDSPSEELCCLCLDWFEI